MTLSTAAAIADDDLSNCEETVQERVIVDGGWRLVTKCVRWADEGGNDGGGSSWDPSAQPVGGFYSVTLTRDDDGELCWEVRWHDSPGYEPNEDTWSWNDAQEVGQETWGEDHARCPGNDTPDPTGAVRALWAETSLLPDNELHIAPGYALTGMPAYLEIHGDRTLSHEAALPAPFAGTATLEASAAYTVDWGNGRVTGPWESSGGPWPDGEIRNAYADRGEVTVVVTATWSGTWSMGGAGGQLPPIEVTHSYPLEVREMRAVRTTPGH